MIKNTKSKINIIFLTGKPASGKDTQAEILSKKLGCEIITTSKEIKKFFNRYKKTYFYIGKVKININKQRKIIEKGRLASYRLVAYLILNILKRKIKENKSLVFAGSPRSIYEAKLYINFLKSKKKVNYYFFYIKISDKTAIIRALNRKENRADDAPLIIRKRLRVFKKEIKPMLDWLKKKKLLIEINGEKTPEEVNEEIMKYVKKL